MSRILLTRLSLGGTEERELIIMPEERSARAIAVWAAVELSRTVRGKYPSSLPAIVCLRNGGWNKLRGRCATKQEKGLSGKVTI